MKRGTTRALNKRLQNIESRLIGEIINPIEIKLINTWDKDNHSIQPTQARLRPEHQHNSRANPIKVKMIENYSGEQNPSTNPITEPQQNLNSQIKIEMIDNY